MQGDVVETVARVDINQLIVTQVYSDLQQKGYLVAPGDVYGGDYCLYQGAVSESHSLATVRIVAESRKVSSVACSGMGITSNVNIPLCRYLRGIF